MSKVWRYGDHVDTDVIIPARYLNIADFKELANHAMEDIDTTFAPKVQPGDIMVAGKNFGCGSSREHAPMVLKVKGVQVYYRRQLCPDFLPQCYQHRPAGSGNRPPGGKDSGRGPGGSGYAAGEIINVRIKT
jgi:hypothetical protein